MSICSVPQPIDGRVAIVTGGASGIGAAVLEPVDIASVIGFLCHPAARYITGQTFHINGGSLMP
jgi:NAD(P)-dependent dehydrogenase (short-subunit alcohol dehydrogenase family)